MLPAEERPIGQPYGMAIFIFYDGSARDHLIYDESFAEDLFEVARENIVGTSP